ncbi:hypothetical protein F7C95_04560 [Opitutia bacterium ISCC 51]|nr:hypothetical protein F7C95_04560 [Opitutae bacterium ISCC 51]QXD29249.1 hypothetical protein GA003_04540 [Opitutae bacterium ISCC 52]
MHQLTIYMFLVLILSFLACSEPADLESDSQVVLSIPKLSSGNPSAGKFVKVTAPEYVGTHVYHTIYLPDDWSADGERLPIIFEYTGNYFPKSGSTGEVKDAGLGFGLSGGKYIWVSLPYIHENHQENQVTWWGDDQATVEYAKVNVPRIIEAYNADPNVVFLCGFSRGAIGVNYLGLHDDEVAKLWTGFITHDHFDGIKEWGKTEWGSPFEKYQAEATERLKRVDGRPYLVCQNGDKYGTETFVRERLQSLGNFTFIDVQTAKLFGSFPNDIAAHPHTDRWALIPSEYRRLAWGWFNELTIE